MFFVRLSFVPSYVSPFLRLSVPSSVCSLVRIPFVCPCPFVRLSFSPSVRSLWVLWRNLVGRAMVILATRGATESAATCDIVQRLDKNHFIVRFKGPLGADTVPIITPRPRGRAGQGVVSIYTQLLLRPKRKEGEAERLSSKSLQSIVYHCLSVWLSVCA